MPSAPAWLILIKLYVRLSTRPSFVIAYFEARDKEKLHAQTGFDLCRSINRGAG
jgi:hypothetical protein